MSALLWLAFAVGVACGGAVVLLLKSVLILELTDKPCRPVAGDTWRCDV